MSEPSAWDALFRSGKAPAAFWTTVIGAARRDREAFDSLVRTAHEELTAGKTLPAPVSAFLMGIETGAETPPPRAPNRPVKHARNAERARRFAEVLYLTWISKNQAYKLFSMKWSMTEKAVKKFVLDHRRIVNSRIASLELLERVRDRL